jgi:hypothetical protein
MGIGPFHAKTGGSAIGLSPTGAWVRAHGGRWKRRYSLK